MAEVQTAPAEKFIGDADALAPKTIDRAGLDLPLVEIAECKIWDEKGVEHRFGSLYDGNVAIVVFVRHFLCYVCKEYVEDLALVPAEKLQLASGQPVRLIVIGSGKHKFIPAFRDATQYKGELFVDPTLTLHKKFGLSDSMGSMSSGKSEHVRSSFLPGLMNTVKRGVAGYGESQGPLTQQGGSFVLGPTITTCQWAHRDASPFDHSPINKLLEVVGFGPVDFAAERRARLQAQ